MCDILFDCPLKKLVYYEILSPISITNFEKFKKKLLFNGKIC